MGKPGAFLEHDRRAHNERSSAQTVHDFDEFAVMLPECEQREQASRCMMCGVAFCQTGYGFGHARTSGCPLHNLIPEWNDLVYRGLWDEAAARLSLTNPFPEFTGRVCPALCEAACNLGRDEEATTIKDDERAISDHQWSNGGPAVLPQADDAAPKVAVVGSGPAGMACAWELARRGARVTLLERHDRAGGLLMYGIPNMKLPKDVVTRRVELMGKSGISVECGVDASDEAVAKRLVSEFDAVVVAVGAASPRSLKADGMDADGVCFAVDYLTSSTKSVLDGGDPAVSAKGKDVVVIGGGDTGTDCVATALRQGAASVHQLEFMPAPPDEPRPDNAWPEWPNVKKTDYGQVEATQIQGEDPRSWGVDTLEVEKDEAGHASALRVVDLDWASGKPERIEGSEHELPAQLVLIACGFSGPEQGVYDALGADVTSVRGGIRPVAEKDGSHRVRTSAGPKGTPVYAAGDARDGSTLVVTAFADGLAAAAEVAADLKL
ncbi:MAG: glutamate synthase subunit beta [Atopobiaceae bacterium]|jgi:glutamate synthase (NADPH/NADH) small chain|nr:glutamate synthase subunit beta [Atopobiaceae bacterium]MCH4213551.1 glutamate synthase subunit beta [Atopobiaceae bacterium]MCH4229639.1 glutamate synthase subunit beta [Atopobiaceae bacterium]MCH4276199.1 glutamate synthase subunit beta [Atopobiaceae bacterium]MCI1226080.1 glutamate synthase subunit beta [Atopobiaceae bacterium]